MITLYVQNDTSFVFLLPFMFFTGWAFTVGLYVKTAHTGTELKFFLGLLESLSGAQESLPGWLES